MEREVIDLSEFDDIKNIIYGDYEDRDNKVIFKFIKSHVEEWDDFGYIRDSVVFQRVSDNKFFEFNTSEFPHTAVEVFPKQITTTIYE